MKIKIEQNSLISLIYFNNLLSFYLTMTRVDRHDNMLKRMFRKYIIYDMHNTTSCTHIPHYAHTYTTLCTHNSHSESLRCTRFQHTTVKNKVKNFTFSAFVHLSNFSNFKFKFSASIQKSNSLVSL